MSMCRRNVRRGAALGAMCALLGQLCSAQTLDLSPPPDPPPLPAPSHVAVVLAELERQASDLKAHERATDDASTQAAQASINIRLIAADLLAAGDRAGRAGSCMVRAAMTLARNCEALDAAVATLHPPAASQPIQTTRPASIDASVSTSLMTLRAFNEAVGARRQDALAWQPDTFEAELAALMQALARSLCAPADQPMTSHWVALDQRSGAPDEISPDALGARIEATALPAHARADLASMAEFAARGAQFAELKPRVDQCRRAIMEIIALDLALTKARWIGESERTAFMQRISDAAARLKDSRDAPMGGAMERIERLARSRGAIESVSSLGESNHEIKPIAAALAAAEAQIDQPATADLGRRRMEALTALLERMAAHRALPQLNVRRELRLIERDVQTAYRAAEESLMKVMLAPGGESQSLADPAFSSMVSDHRELLEVLQLLRRVPEWLAASTSLDFASSDQFVRQLTKMCKGLLDAHRRPDAVAALQGFDQRLRSAYPLPFEEDLRAATAPAIELSGGFHAELLSLAVEARRLWLEGWAHGQPDAPAARLALVLRLMQAMVDLSEASSQGVRIELLNRWSAWELDAEAITRPASEAMSRLKLAAAALVNGDDGAAGEQLDRIEHEAALVRLAARLATRLGEGLGLLPDGACGAAAQLAHPPTAATFLGHRNRDVAELCRYAAEAEQARASGHREAADALARHVNVLAARLITELPPTHSN